MRELGKQEQDRKKEGDQRAHGTCVTECSLHARGKLGGKTGEKMGEQSIHEQCCQRHEQVVEIGKGEQCVIQRQRIGLLEGADKQREKREGVELLNLHHLNQTNQIQQTVAKQQMN